MSSFHTKLIAGLFGVISVPSFAMDIYQDSGMTFKGSTGLLLVPTAQVIEHGALGYGMNNFLFPGYPAKLESENYFVTAGVWKGFEAQVGLNETHWPGSDPDKYGDFYKRDLVGNAKYSFDLFDPSFRLAIGGQDLTGLAVYSQRLYGVGTYLNELGSVSLGYSVNPGGTNNPNSKLHLDGLFGGVQMNLPYGFAVLAEYDGVYKRAGLRYRLSNLFGTKVHLNAQASLLSDAPDEDSILGLSLAIPLGAKASEVASSLESGVENELAEQNIDLAKYRVYYPDASEQIDTLKTENVDFKEEQEKVNDFAASGVSPNEFGSQNLADKADVHAVEPSPSVRSLVEDLEESGLHFVAVKQDADTLYIRYQNRLFDWSEEDALAQAIALSAGYAYQNKIANLQIEVWSEQNPVLSVKLSPSWALDKPINHDVRPHYFEPHFEQLGMFSDRQADWDVENGRTAWVSVKMEPVLSNTIGSEIGVYHYSLGLNTEVSSELWKGGRISINRTDLIRNSSQYEEGGFFADYAIPSDYIQAVLQQTLVPFKGLVNTVSYHHPLKEGVNTYQLIDEWRYYAFGGRHQVYGYGAYKWSDEPSSNYHDGYFYGFNGYEYFWPEEGISFNAERGKYVNEDLTTKLTLRSYVGDSQFRASWIREDSGYEKVYVGVTVPLTPRKALSLGPVSIRGEGKWSYGIQTVIDDPNSTGVNINLGDPRYRPFGFYISQPYEPHDSIMDSGRLTPVYLNSSPQRLKNKIEEWLR